MNQTTNDRSLVSPSRKTLGILSAKAAAASALLFFLLAPGARANTPPAPGAPAAAPSFLLSPVERELGGGGKSPAALEAIYLLHVRTLDEAAIFFQSPAFLRLGLAAQRHLLDGALERDPAAFLGQSDFLPVSLRGAYRQRALAAADPVAAPAAGAAGAALRSARLPAKG